MKQYWARFLRPALFGAALAAACVIHVSGADGDTPTDAESARLAKELGDGDSTIRQKAAWGLREIGRPALSALRAAAGSDDPEVQAAAKAAIKAIDNPLPEPTDGPRYDELIQADEQHWAVAYHEGQRVVRVEGDVRQQGEPYGHLKLTFTGPLNGKQTTVICEADNEERLKWDHPQAWMFFHRYYNHESDMAAVRMPNNALSAKVSEAMNRLKFSADERKEVADRLRRFSDASSKALATSMYEPDSAPQALADEYRECDALRKFLLEKKLPVVEGQGEMDPPPEARLGLDFLTDRRKFPPDAQSGLLILFAAAGERADRIGVRPGDVLQRINGTAIESPAQLSPACLACTSGMTIDVFRNGKTITLHERPNPGTTKP